MNLNLFGFQISVKRGVARGRYGWKPDLPDHRDIKYAVTAPGAPAITVPSSVDLSIICPPVYNQGDIGSCTANAIAAAIEFDQDKQDKVKDFMPSRLFIYYNERAMEGTVNEDSGAQIRDGIKSVNVQGVCPESVWPYSDWRMVIAPSKAARAAALLHKSLQYQRVDNSNIANLKAVLATGYPIVFGFTVYDAFEGQEVANTGILNLPAPGEQVLGGHAVLCVGYDDKTQRVKVRNSWGPTWGMKGYFTMPYSYITNTNLADDFWTIKSITGA